MKNGKWGQPPFMIQFKHAKNKKVDIGDEIYHVINRSNARVQIFDDVADYKLFETILEEAVEKFERMVADPIFSLVTPLTPGSRLIIVGLELLGVHILFLDKFKFWKK